MDKVGFVCLKNKRQLDLLPIFLAIVLGAMIASRLNTARDIGRPFGGFLSFYNVLSADGEEYIKDSTPPWWPPFSDDLLTLKDRISTIDGQYYKSHTVREIYGRLWDNGERTADLYLWRPGGHQKVTIPLQIFTIGQFLEVSTANFLVGLGFWLTAVVIYRGQPFEPLNRITALVAGAIAGYGGTTPYSLFGGSLALILENFSLLCLGLIAPATIHLALHFPRPIAIINESKYRHQYQIIIKLLYGLGIGNAILYVLSKLLFWVAGADLHLVRVLDGTAFYTLNRYLGLAYIILIMRLVNAALRDPTPRHRRESSLLIAGLIGCFLPIYSIVGTAFSDLTITGYMGSLQFNYLLLTLPIALCVIILRYKTFRPLSALFMAAPLLMISALLASAQTVLAVSRDIVPDSKGIFLFLAGFTLVFFSSSIWNYQSSWQGFFRRLLHWERTTIDNVKAFGEGMLATADLAELPATIAPSLCKFLDLERAAVWTWHEEDAFTLVSQAGLWTNPLPIHLKEVNLPPAPLRLTRLTREVGLPFYSWEEVEVLVPLQVTAEPVGLLILGKRWDEAVFDERDLDSIALIGQQAALFLLSARQIQHLRQVPQQLSATQERERNHLAQELHDSTEQFLGRLPFTLEELRAEIHEGPEKADQLIENCLKEINDEARNLRRIRNSMAPTQLDQNFGLALENLIENLRTRGGIQCQLALPPNIDEKAPNSIRLPLYRVIQQALDNIMEHASASQVQVLLQFEKERLVINITDNGRGFTTEDRQKAQKDGSFGLMSMAARVQNLGGELEIESTVGVETRVFGWIPIKLEGVEN